MRDEEKSKEELLTELRSLHAELAQMQKADSLVKVLSNHAVDRVPGSGLEPYRMDSDQRERKVTEEALTKELIQRRVLFEQSRDGIVVLDQDGKVYEANQQFADMLRYPLDEIGQLHVWDWDTQWSRRELEEQIRLVDAEGDFFETRHQRKDGTIYDVEISTNGAVFSGEKLVFCVCRDISQRKAAEVALRESEKKYRTLFESMNQGVFYQRADGIIIDANPAALRMLGLTFGEFVNSTADDHSFDVTREDGSVCPWPEHPSMEALKTGKPVDDVVLRVFNPSGKTYKWILVNAIPEFRQGEAFPHQVFVTLYDITKIKQAEEALRKSERDLRLLSSRLLAAQEEERKRIAHELHDSIGGALSAIKFGLENALCKMYEGEAAPEPLQALVATTQQAIEEARRIYMDLRPSILDDLGLITAIGWFTRQFGTIYPCIHVEKHIEMEEERIPKDLKIIIFRVIQEALHNVAKHSRAEWIDLSLTDSDGMIELAVTDDGIGFKMDDILQEGTLDGGLGLSSMQERVECSGGIFLIRSMKGEGTTVRASWELNRTE